MFPGYLGSRMFWETSLGLRKKLGLKAVTSLNRCSLTIVLRRRSLWAFQIILLFALYLTLKLLVCIVSFNDGVCFLS